MKTCFKKIIFNDFRKSEEIGQIFSEIITSLKNHWIQLYLALKSCASSAKASDYDEHATAIADVFRSLRSTCDCESFLYYIQ